MISGRNIFYFFILIIFWGCDAPDNDWDSELNESSFYKIFGGNKEEYGFSVDTTRDGGYILAGFSTTYGNGDWDVWIVKTDSSGSGMWSRTFGTSGREAAFHVKQANDGGYWLLGEHGVSGQAGNILLIKTNEDGMTQNEFSFGGTKNDGARQIIPTSDGGYAIIGYTYSSGGGGRDMWLIKIDGNGQEEWSQTYGWVYSEMGYSLVQTADDGFILVGYKFNPYTRNNNLWIIKTDASGKLEWDRLIDEDHDSYGHKIIKSSDGFYTIGGVTNKLGNDWYDYLIMKIDFNGNIAWKHIHSMSHATINNWYHVDIHPTNDGGFVGVGPTDQYGYDSDAILMKFDASGNIKWADTYGGKGQDIGLSVVQTRDGGYAFLGRSNSHSNGLYDYLFVKTDSLGRSVRFPN